MDFEFEDNEKTILTKIHSGAVKEIKDENGNIVDRVVEIPEGVKIIRKDVFEKVDNSVLFTEIEFSLDDDEKGTNKKTVEGEFPYNVTKVIIPTSVETIESRAFMFYENEREYTNLKEIEFKIDDEGKSNLTFIGADAFYGCTALRSLTIPDSDKEQVIYEGIVRFCSELESLTYSDHSIASIGTKSFLGCNKLKELNMCGKIRSWNYGPSIDELGFNVGGDNGDVITEFDKDIKRNLFSKTGIQRLTLPKLEKIRFLAFNDDEQFVSITIQEGVIEKHAFSDCKNLSEVNIKNGVMSVGRGAFEHCLMLEKVNIEDGIKFIDRDAFSTCYRLMYLRLPAGVDIGDHAFDDCRGLTDIIFPGEQVKIGLCAFSNCKKITSIKFLSRKTEMGRHAFDGCIMLDNIEFLKDELAEEVVQVEPYKVIIGKDAFGGREHKPINKQLNIVFPDGCQYEILPGDEYTMEDITNLLQRRCVTMYKSEWEKKKGTKEMVDAEEEIER